MEDRSIGGEVSYVFLTFTPFKLLTISVGILVSLQNTFSNNYVKFKVNLFSHDTQNTCLKWSYFGAIRYRKNGQESFLLVCEPMGASVIQWNLSTLCSMYPGSE